MLKIEQECHVDPWDAKTFNKCLNYKNTDGIVIHCQNELCGYLIFEKNADSLRIINLTVAPKKQRLGFGTELVNALKHWIYPNGLLEMKLSDRCLDAHLFLSKQGFRAEKTIQNYFKVGDEYEDAYCFVFHPIHKSTVKLELKEIYEDQEWQY